MFEHCSLTRALNEGPVVVVLHGTHADVKDGLQAVLPRCGRGRHPDRASVRAFDALPLAGVARIGAPAAAGLLQTVSARAVARTVFSY